MDVQQFRHMSESVVHAVKAHDVYSSGTERTLDLERFPDAFDDTE